MAGELTLMNYTMETLQKHLEEVKSSKSKSKVNPRVFPKSILNGQLKKD